MRAIYFEFNKNDHLKTILVDGETARHLQVARVALSEEVLVLNGQGFVARSKVKTIFKNQIELEVYLIDECKRSHEINLAIAAPKKEAFFDILKIAVELGVNKVYPLSSDYSQYEYLENDRVQRILESALVQSNNPFFPSIYPQSTLENFLHRLDGRLYFFNSKPNHCGKVEKISGGQTVLIGPEGGFSLGEEALILSRSNVFSIHLPTPILRAPTAVASAIGFLLS